MNFMIHRVPGNGNHISLSRVHVFETGWGVHIKGARNVRIEDCNIAHIQLDRILRSRLEKIHFTWAGMEENKPYYYRIHGPTVIIEFDNHYPPRRSSGPINHIHTVFREPGNDYGDDLLKNTCWKATNTEQKTQKNPRSKRKTKRRPRRSDASLLN